MSRKISIQDSIVPHHLGEVYLVKVYFYKDLNKVIHLAAHKNGEWLGYGFKIKEASCVR